MKKRVIFILVSLFSMALVLYLSYSSGTPLREYIPKNREEKEVVFLLIKFQTAKQQFDLENYLSCLDENGVFMHSGHLMVKKKELATLLPDFWQGFKDNNAHYKPMNRENLNGNFLDGAFYNPIITVIDDTAHVTVTFQTPIVRWRTFLFINLTRKNNRWLISRYEWDMG